MPAASALRLNVFGSSAFWSSASSYVFHSIKPSGYQDQTDSSANLGRGELVFSALLGAKGKT